mgnify:CR=1 FL=1
MKEKIRFKVYDLVVEGSTPFQMPDPIPYFLGFTRIGQDTNGYRIEMLINKKWKEVSLEEIPELISKLKEEE